MYARQLADTAFRELARTKIYVILDKMTPPSPDAEANGILETIFIKHVLMNTTIAVFLQWNIMEVLLDREVERVERMD